MSAQGEQPELPSIEGYRVHRRLGSGGMGEVFLATTEGETPRRVAIKILRPSLSVEEKILRRFTREAAVGDRLRHPHILPVLSIRSRRGSVLLEMDYVEGSVLGQRSGDSNQETQPWPETSGPGPRTQRRFAPRDSEPLRQRVEALTKICYALDYAHQRGVVHRDVKPSNILIRRDGHPYLIDFGIARILDASRLTSTGGNPGTSLYMSPEHICGRPLDPRADIYSMGVTLFETLTGMLPFPSENFEELRREICEGEPPTIDPGNSPFIEGLDRIILRAMEKRRRNRYPTAGELARDLERVLRGEDPLVGRITLQLRKSQRKVLRRRIEILVGAAIILVLLAGALARRVATSRSQARRSQRNNLVMEAQWAASEGNLDQAESRIADAMELFPNDASLHLILATCYAQFSDWQRVREERQRAQGKGVADRPPQTPLEHFTRGLWLMLTGEPEKMSEAERELSKAVEEDSKLVGALYPLYTARLELGDISGGRKALQQYRESLPSRLPFVRVIDSLILELDRAYPEAAEILEGLLLEVESDPEQLHTLGIARALGRIYVRMGEEYLWKGEPLLLDEMSRSRSCKVEESLALLHLRATQTNAPDPKKRSVLDHAKEAVRYSLRAVESSPHCRVAFELLVKSRIRKLRVGFVDRGYDPEVFKDARSALAQLEEKDPDNPGLSFLEAELYYLEGATAWHSNRDLTKAVPSVRAAVASFEGHFEALLLLGQLLWYEASATRETIRQEKLFRESFAVLTRAETCEGPESGSNSKATALVWQVGAANHAGILDAALQSLERVESRRAQSRLTFEDHLTYAEFLGLSPRQETKNCDLALELIGENWFCEALVGYPGTEAKQILEMIISSCSETPR